MTLPTAFYDTAQTVLDCVCAAMDALTDTEDIPDGYACPCVAFVSAGEPALDCCTDGPCDGSSGQLTTHIENAFPSNVFPTPLADFEPCKAATWVVAVVVTVARCAPVMDSQGNDASPEEKSANALLMGIDQWAVMSALGCCVVDDVPPGKRKRRVQIVGSTPLVTSGGCAAIEIRAFVEAGSVCGCTEGS